MEQLGSNGPAAMMLRREGLKSIDGSLGSQLLGYASTSCLRFYGKRTRNMQERNLKQQAYKKSVAT